MQVPAQSIASGDRRGREDEMFGDKATRKRIKLARSLERAAVPERPYIGRGPRYLVHPTITAACAPSLLAIAAALRNDPTAFSDDELKPVQSFITNGWSPFFGRDETAAMREAVRLQHAVLDRETRRPRSRSGQAGGRTGSASESRTDEQCRRKDEHLDRHDADRGTACSGRHHGSRGTRSPG